ncbi:MAG: tRNA 2-thiouridine(34) synthase MnmA, partial [Rhodospirillaceae bacterium]|nr:tRNA 2-thiouridine(34) synthase MnmA [Rhodospirillaceae bacterium]
AGPELHAGADAGRDQSYFLFATTREQLGMLRFPLGGLDKEATRAIARRHGLTVSDKPDSQDICFVPNGDYASLVARLRPDAHRPGEIVDRDGVVLGRHDGIARFTVGQRRGLGIGGGGIHYVLRLEPDTARVVVGPREALARRRVTLGEVNWLGEPIPAAGLDCEVKVRSTRPPAPARLIPGDAGWVVDLVEPEFGVAPGQACVFYAGDRVLGGGWIRRELAAKAA